MTVLPAKPLSAVCPRQDCWVGGRVDGKPESEAPEGRNPNRYIYPRYSICSLFSCSQARRAVPLSLPLGPHLASLLQACPQFRLVSKFGNPTYVSVSNNYLMSQLCVKYRCQQTDISIFVCAHLENSRPLVPYSSALSWSMRTEAPRIAWCTSMARRMLFANGAFYDAQWAVCHSAC